MTLPSDFQRLLEDVLREEILTMGHEFSSVVERIIPRREGGVYAIRFRDDLEDLDVVEPSELPTRQDLAAQLRRKLERTLHG